LRETFEGAFPGDDWALVDLSDEDDGEFLWGATDYVAATGQRSGWPARGGEDGLDPAEWFYPNNMETWMVTGPFDLSGATEFQIVFQVAISTEADYVVLFVGASDDIIDSWGEFYSGDYPTWQQVVLDLSAYAGEPEVYVGLAFVSDESNVSDGPFVDDIVIRARG